MAGRKVGTQGSENAQKYISSRFQAIGVKPLPGFASYQHAFNWPLDSDNKMGVNLVGLVHGLDKSADYIVITAHYDHLGQRGRKIYNGADDNASGVAALIAIAEQLVKTPGQYNVILLVTDAEELGLYGAKAFVRKPPVALERIRFNLNLDMLANGGTKKRLYVFGHRFHDPFIDIFERLKGDVGVCLNSHRNGARGVGKQRGSDWRKASDHGPFASQKIPFLFLSAGDHNQYHTAKDTIDYIDPNFYQAVVETALRFYREIDKLP